MSEHAFPNVDDLVERNQTRAADFDASGLDKLPSRKVAIVTCMDARIDVFAMLGLHNGEAHIIRNAGGAVTDDAIRSLCLSQRYLGTKEILVIHHTDCGLHNLNEDEFNAEIEADLGVRPPWALESFHDPVADVRQSMKRIELSPYISDTEHMSGFVYDVATGNLEPVSR